MNDGWDTPQNTNSFISLINAAACLFSVFGELSGASLGIPLRLSTKPQAPCSLSLIPHQILNIVQSPSPLK